MNAVKFVPELSTNLISIGKMAQKNYSVFFDEKGCKIVNIRGLVIATGARYGGLYYLDVQEKLLVAMNGQHKVDCQHQWHRRLSHHDWAAAERILKEDLATGMR